MGCKVSVQVSGLNFVSKCGLESGGGAHGCA